MSKLSQLQQSGPIKGFQESQPLYQQQHNTTNSQHINIKEEDIDEEDINDQNLNQKFGKLGSKLLRCYKSLLLGQDEKFYQLSEKIIQNFINNGQSQVLNYLNEQDFIQEIQQYNFQIQIIQKKVKKNKIKKLLTKAMLQKILKKPLILQMQIYVLKWLKIKYFKWLLNKHLGDQKTKNNKKQQFNHKSNSDKILNFKQNLQLKMTNNLQFRVAYKYQKTSFLKANKKLKKNYLTNKKKNTKFTSKI
ncbi:hypothetical protein IMG5_130490 [Ichthyophthirius multifiliis]|uniref:Uncharacterized protein n=1 Tax=Ichthyophthirius multifiliis TaxID=5932 RepID=G0QWA3_ICHMU|nr:hypothetical protein IMG5_130490 [Ichthyophthirius multifiliis]EGR30498.1 hypothetical protein IMG5_130490 [Ichthyophthirius multifiliis]|eukprot:XP_004032085.1 hypothetical protein IMG5_130490 [Ichthyophthirius multifiliis]